jgi:hypothetical protein
MCQEFGSQRSHSAFVEATERHSQILKNAESVTCPSLEKMT